MQTSPTHGFSSRGDFLKKAGLAGVMLTMPALHQACSSLPGRNAGPRDADPLRNAEKLGLESPILRALNVGITAPNAHNTQAWKFIIHNDREMSLYVDEKRLLLATDPTTRQIHISQGTLLEHLAIGATRMGYRADIRLLPEGDYSMSETGKKPVARVKLIAARAMPTDPLYAQISRRATNRTAYQGPLVTAGEFAELKSAIGSAHGDFIFHNRDMDRYLEQFRRAYAVETNTRERHEESRIWFRYNDKQIFSKRDGISLRGGGLSGVKLWFAEKFFVSEGAESWHSPSGRQTGIDIFNDALKTTKGLIFLKTPGNERKDWILAGRDYARLHLAVTAQGLVMHPLSQILQEYPEMNELRAGFRAATGLKGRENIQMITRLGRADYLFLSPRRPLSAMLTKA